MKKLLRSKYKEIRRSIIDKEDRNNIIFNRVINNTKVIDADTLLLYVSNEEEVDTINIIKYFINKKKIGVPRIDNGIMNFYYINSLDELMEGYFGILEPISNNKIEDFSNTVSITPGICFSYDLYRNVWCYFSEKFLIKIKNYTHMNKLLESLSREGRGVWGVRKGIE